MPYVLVFKGELEPEASRQAVVEMLAEKLRESPADLEERLFTGGSVRIATVDTRDEAKRYVRVFAKAGAKLEAHLRPPPGVDKVRPAPGDATEQAARPVDKATPPGATSAPEPTRRARWAATAAVAIVVSAIMAAAWYTSPIWKRTPVSAERLTVSNALAAVDLIGIGHLDVERALNLNSRLYGARDPGALLSADDTWDSLVAAGIRPEDADDVVVALYDGPTGPYWALAVTGRFDGAAIRDWIGEHYDFDSASGDTVTFSWLDERTCERVPSKAARVSSSLVLITEAERIDDLWSRMESRAPAELQTDDWLAMTGTQLLTVGVMRPAGIEHAARGVAGMLLAAAGKAAEPAEALYFGATPVLAPPGVQLSAAVASSDPEFLELVNRSASNWLDEVRGTAAGRPELLDLLDRIAFGLDPGMFTAGIRFDTNVDEEIETLLAGVVQRSFGITPAGSVQERLEDNPFQFADATPLSLRDYGEFGSAFGEPTWQDGPFGLRVSRLMVDDDGRPQFALQAEGRGLINVGKRAKLVRMRVSEVSDASGASLLPPQRCGGDQGRDWQASSLAFQGSHFGANNELIYTPRVTLDRTITLADGTNPEDVASVRGEIEYRMPVRVRTIRVESPVGGEIVNAESLRVAFEDGSEHSIAYRLSGDPERLVEVRGLNAEGKVLASSSSSSSSSWFGSGENVSIDLQGTLSAVELIVAEEFETLSYAFELPSAYPDLVGGSGLPTASLDIAQPDAVGAAMQLAPPDVSFDWNQPVATTAAGPAFVAVERLQANEWMGLATRLAVYVPDAMPLAGHLNGGSVTLDHATLADGTSIALALETPLALSTDGGYWSDDGFVPDPERPWLKGGADLQLADYESGVPVAIDGRLAFRAPVETQRYTMPAQPGSGSANAGVDLFVSEWRANSIDVDIRSGADRILSIVAIDADGKPVSGTTALTSMGGGLEARVGNLVAIPTSLEVLVALESARHEVAFLVDIGTVGDHQAGLDQSD